MNQTLRIIIGAYGSGKSEYAINLARLVNRERHRSCLVDLDVVNPYFRSRDVREEFSKEGIEVISPEGAFSHADLPMLSPKIRGAIVDPQRYVILDAGGDPAGCRILSRFRTEIENRGYDMTLVVNTRRPFTGTAADIIEMAGSLEATAGLKITRLICNTNLMEHTARAVVEDGIGIVEDVAQRLSLPFDEYLVLDSYAERVPDGLGGKKRIVLNYFLKKPWEASGLNMRGI